MLRGMNDNRQSVLSGAEDGADYLCLNCNFPLLPGARSFYRPTPIRGPEMTKFECPCCGYTHFAQFRAAAVGA